jgi:uncharacterized protein YndB with AHSA1/START domain
MTDFTSHPAITKALAIDAPPAKVWSALTRPDMIQRWMAEDGLTVRSEWQAGSTIPMKGNLHDVAFENRGTIH